MTYKRLSIDDEVLTAAIAAMEELASIRRERLTDDDADALEGVRLLEHQTTRLRDEIKYADSQPTPDEEMAAIDALIKKMSKSAGYSMSGKRAVVIRNYYESILSQREKAYSTLARFVDDQRVKLQSVKFMMRGAMHGATHREKEGWLRRLLTVMDAICEDLSGLNVDDVWSFDEFRRGTEGSWDYRQLARELHYKNAQVAELEEKLKQYEPEEANGETPKLDAFLEQDRIPF